MPFKLSEFRSLSGPDRGRAGHGGIGGPARSDLHWGIRVLDNLIHWILALRLSAPALVIRRLR
jgi:hypothetical protein